MNISEYKCSTCTGPLRFDEKSNKLICDYCGSEYDVKEYENTEDHESKINFSDGELVKYTCHSCGAEILCDKTTSATTCPYCDNPLVLNGQFYGEFKPDYIIPFKLDKQQAVNGLMEFYKGKKFIPDLFLDQNHIEDIKGLYVPFWLYDQKAIGLTKYKGEKEKVYTQGDTEYTETMVYEITRGGNVGFKKIPFDSSTKIPDEFMDAIEPFDYKEMKPFSKNYLPGFLADKYDVTKGEGKKKVDERSKETLRKLLRKSVKGFSKVLTTYENLETKYTKSYYALMPVWILTTRWNDETFMFAMNGQTGKFVGKLPVDMDKYKKTFTLIATLAGIAFALIWAAFTL